MEYLTLSGTLRLKSTVDEDLLNLLLKKMDDIPFERHGMVLIERQDDVLSIEAEGEISEEVSVGVVSLLHSLKTMATETSYIMVDCIRWEINITLVSNDCLASNPGGCLLPLIRNHDNNKLILL